MAPVAPVVVWWRCGSARSSSARGSSPPWRSWPPTPSPCRSRPCASWPPTPRSGPTRASPREACRCCSRAPRCATSAPSCARWPAPPIRCPGTWSGSRRSTRTPTSPPSPPHQSPRGSPSAPTLRGSTCPTRCSAGRASSPTSVPTGCSTAGCSGRHHPAPRCSTSTRNGRLPASTWCGTARSWASSGSVRSTSTARWSGCARPRSGRRVTTCPTSTTCRAGCGTARARRSSCSTSTTHHPPPR